MDAAARARTLALLGIEARGHPHPGQHYTHGWIPVNVSTPGAKQAGALAQKQAIRDLEQHIEKLRREGPPPYRRTPDMYVQTDLHARIHGLPIGSRIPKRPERLGFESLPSGHWRDPATGRLHGESAAMGWGDDILAAEEYLKQLKDPGYWKSHGADAAAEIEALKRRARGLKMRRDLELAGIETRAYQQSQSTGTDSGGKTAHEPAGSPKGGQFTSSPSGAGGGYEQFLSSGKSGGGKKKSSAAPANTPQPPSSSRTMKPGDSGEDVRYAQYAMSLLGFKVAQDGTYGPETEAAVKQMQERLGVAKPNGHLSPALLHKMQDAVRLSPCVGAGQRDLALEAQWEQRDVDDEDDEPDDTAQAVLDAIDEVLERSADPDWDERAHDVSKELRIPGHHEGGGRWTTGGITKAIAKALEDWSKGEGPDDPFTLPPDPTAAREVEVENSIRAAYRAASADSGRSSLVPLADVREKLGQQVVLGQIHGLDRAEVDAALTRMARGGSARLTPDEDRKNLKTRQKAAALRIPGYGSEDFNHWLTIEDPSPRPLPTGKPIDREPLRKAAVARGITLKRGAPREDIVKALLDDVRGGVAAKKAQSPHLPGAPKDHRRFTIQLGGEPAGTVRAEGYVRGADVELRVVADGKGGYLGQRRPRGTSEWQDDPSLGTGNTPKDITSRHPRADWSTVRAPAGSGPAKTADVGIFGNPSTGKLSLYRESDTGKQAKTGAKVATGNAALKATAVNPTGDQLAAVTRLGGDGAYVVNDDLRANGGKLDALTPKNRATVEALDLLMQGSPLKQDIVVHRKLGNRNPFSTSTGPEVDPLNRNLTGFTWTEQGYSSTDIEGKNLEHRGISLRITVPSGTPAISHKELDNGEVLLPRGLTFKVTKDNGGFPRHLDVEVVPAKAEQAKTGAPSAPAAKKAPPPATPSLDRATEDRLRLLEHGPYQTGLADVTNPFVRKRYERQIAEMEDLRQRGLVRVTGGRLPHGGGNKPRYELSAKGKAALDRSRSEAAAAEAGAIGVPTERVAGRDITAKSGLAARVLNDVRSAPGYNPRREEDSDIGDPAGERLAGEIGYAGPPQLADPASFDRMVNDGSIGQVLYRGVEEGNYKKTAGEIQREWRVGRYHMGLGTFGNGSYMAVNRAHAKEYADGTPGSFGRFGLRKDARVVKWDDLIREHDDYHRGTKDGDPERQLYGDVGRFAMARGYDAISVPKGTHPGFGAPAGGDQYVVLNRTAVIAEVPRGTGSVAKAGPGAGNAPGVNAGTPGSHQGGGAGGNLGSTAAGNQGAGGGNRGPSAGRVADPAAILSSLPADLTPAQKRARLRSRGVPKEQIDALVPLAPRKKAAKAARSLAGLGVTRALGHDVTPGHDELHHYWTRGEGLAKWAESPKPWTTLVAHLTKYVGPEKAKIYASRWFIEVFHFAAGSDLNRVTHGKPPRGHRVGPG
jgi:ADP-ribosyltransferase exoenzyme/putative peptidoglycan binding protein